MARDGSGNYSIPNTFTSGTVIASSAVNANFADIATALTGSLARNSEGPMTAALVMHANGAVYEVDPDTGIKRTGTNEQAIFCGGANVIVFGTATISIAVALFVGTLAASTFSMTTSDNGATEGPTLVLMRESTSPAAADVMGAIRLKGRDSAANIEDYVGLFSEIIDPTSGSEDSRLRIRVRNNGADSDTTDDSGAWSFPRSITVANGFTLSAGAFSVPAASISEAALAHGARTCQRLLSGTAATYTTPAGCRALKVIMIGGGAGGGATITNNGSSGGTTTFNSINAAGGSGGTAGGNGGAGGTGGTGGTGTADLRLSGSDGSTGAGAVDASSGGSGAPGIFGMGSGRGGANGAGQNAKANTGAGGGGAGNGQSPDNNGGGGGSGEYVELDIPNPSATYTYTVGTGGNGGAAGTQAGGNGATGIIIVEEYY